MKKTLILLAAMVAISAHAQNPFAEYGYTPKIATFSNGQFNEFHDLDTIVRIGSVLFNTRSEQIIGFVEKDTLNPEATLEPDIVSRWLSPDPLAAKYPELSPYNFVANNPIIFIDPDGRDIVLPTSLKGTQRRKIMRNLQRLTHDKLSYDETTGKVVIKKVNSSTVRANGTALITNLITDSRTTTIGIGAKGSGNSANATNWTHAQDGTGSDAEVSFDPTANPDILTESPRTGNVRGKKRPDFIGLAHELIHADHITNGDVDLTGDTHTYKDAMGTPTTQTVRKEELRTVGLKGVKPSDITENEIRAERPRTKRKQRGAY